MRRIKWITWITRNSLVNKDYASQWDFGQSVSHLTEVNIFLYLMFFFERKQIDDSSTQYKKNNNWLKGFSGSCQLTVTLFTIKLKINMPECKLIIIYSRIYWFFTYCLHMDKENLSDACVTRGWLVWTNTLLYPFIGS